MARWIDDQGVYHDTDLLEYGNQGDTRYWEGKPGATGSTAYTAPEGGEGREPLGKVSQQIDLSKGILAPILAAIAKKAKPQVAAPVTPAVPQGPRTPAVVMRTIYANDDSLNYYSEMAARWLAEQEGIPIEQARVELQKPERAIDKQAGLYWAYNQDNPQPAGGAKDINAQWQEFMNAVLAGQEEERKKEQARWQAGFDLEKSQFEERKGQHRQNLAAALLGTAATLRGPRDYGRFLAYTSGGRTLAEQLRGNQPRAAFGVPAGPIEGMTLADLMKQLGLTGEETTPTVQKTDLPLPYQIDPGVWNSLGLTGQQMVLGLAEQAGWDPDEFMRQLSAARPAGTAARFTRYT